MSKQLSYPKEKIKILLLEEVHPVSIKKLQDNGFTVDVIPRSLTPQELTEHLAEAHILGIRSKTKVSEEHIQNAKRLMAIGCFGVGTNQVALDAASRCGVPVFNAPFGNTRSVAELAIGMVIALARKAGDKNAKLHQGVWDKSAKGAIEIRGKTIGVVGFGHIGQQVGLLAQALGMNVLFFDTIRKLEIGSTRQVETMEELLAESDFVTLHVPAVPGRALIGKEELAQMKKGSYLLNLSRGTLIDFAALKEAIQSKHLAGAGIDVYPAEPKTNSEPFQCELAGVENVFLTPHIGGSTEEAQYNIGVEVAQTFTKFINTGATRGAVNFPQVDLPPTPDTHRILNVHRNQPGVLTEVNKLVSDLGANVESQYLSTYKDIGYLIMDVNSGASEELKEKIAGMSQNIKTRILY